MIDQGFDLNVETFFRELKESGFPESIQDFFAVIAPVLAEQLPLGLLLTLCKKFENELLRWSKFFDTHKGEKGKVPVLMLSCMNNRYYYLVCCDGQSEGRTYDILDDKFVVGPPQDVLYVFLTIDLLALLEYIKKRGEVECNLNNS